MSNRIENDYEKYVKFLLENGANEDIVQLAEVKHIVINLISWANPLALQKGLTPVKYYKPKKDGTFTIGGRTTGLNVNIKFFMNYCKENDEDHFIELKRKDVKTILRSSEFPEDVPYRVKDTTTITINRKGEVSSYKTLRKRKLF